MARFRLTEKHYLNVDNCEWEHKEEVQGKVRGRNRQARKVYPVPMYLDPKDIADQNYEDQIIVSTKADIRFPDDYLIRGEFSPTLDMEPLDDEAFQLMEEFKANYKGEHPIESLSGSYAENVLSEFTKQLEALMKGNAGAVAVPSEIEKLKAENAALNAKLDKLMAMLTPPPASAPVSGDTRRGL